MRKISFPLIIGASLVLSACLGRGEEPVNSNATEAGTSPQAIDQRIGILPPQSLEEGRCGTFLWARRSEADLVLFSSGPDFSARMMIDGQQIDIPRTRAEGTAVFGHFVQSSFATEGQELSVELTMNIERRAGIIGGAVVESGSIRLIQADGWEFVLPVAGLIACQAD